MMESWISMYTELQKKSTSFFLNMCLIDCILFCVPFENILLDETRCNLRLWSALTAIERKGFYRDIPAVTRDLSLSALPHRATPVSDLDLLRQARGTEDLF